jgi:nitric oxide reductase NorD protein
MRRRIDRQREDLDQPALHADVQDEQKRLDAAGRFAPDQRGIVIAKYPEWDRAHGISSAPNGRRCAKLPRGKAIRAQIEEALDRAEMLRSRIRRLVRGVRDRADDRLKRQHRWP